jgi:predicted RNA-binding protein with PUA-like domain
MAPDDPLLIYHSGATKEIVGLARVVSQPYTDPNQKTSGLTVVDIEVEGRLPQRVSLAAIKADPAFADLALVRQPRLSVIPVPEPLWKKLLAMGGLTS